MACQCQSSGIGVSRKRHRSTVHKGLRVFHSNGDLALSLGLVVVIQAVAVKYGRRPVLLSNQWTFLLSNSDL